MDEARFMAEMAKARASDKHGERSTAFWEGFERGQGYRDGLAPFVNDTPRCSNES